MLCSRESLQVPRESLLPLETVTHTTLCPPARRAATSHARRWGRVYRASEKIPLVVFFAVSAARRRDMAGYAYGGIWRDTGRDTRSDTRGYDEIRSLHTMCSRQRP